MMKKTFVTNEKEAVNKGNMTKSSYLRREFPRLVTLRAEDDMFVRVTLRYPRYQPVQTNTRRSLHGIINTSVHTGGGEKSERPDHT